MKLPSVHQITEASMRSFRRFPFVLTAAITGMIAAIVIIEFQSREDPLAAYPLFFAALLGVPLLLGLKLFAEKRAWSIARTTVLQLSGVVLLGFYAWSLPADIPGAPAIHLIRLLLLVIAMHLFVSVAPWTGRGEINAFWHFNKALFLRFLLSALFSAVLYAGLAIALAAVEQLFELHVPGERYPQLWIVLTGLFMTWFFLAGIPENLEALEAREDYPKGLKIFAQYVLLPLVVIYLLILIAYSAKIIVVWSWPQGWVSALILGFSAAGIFSLLLLHPIRDREGGTWITAAARWFFIALAPLLVMYFLAVMRRLSDYGFTEARYIGIVTGIWLAAITLYFLFTRGTNIKFIPLSLCVLAALVSFGPWGAFSVSEHSQIGRLRSLLEENEMLSGGSVRQARMAVSINDRREISAVLDYLHQVHGYGEIQRWFDEPLREDTVEARSHWKSPADVAAMLDIEFLSAPRSAPGNGMTFSVSPTAVMIVEGYDRVLPRHTFSHRGGERTFTAGRATISLDSALDTLTFMLAEEVKEDAHTVEAGTSITGHAYSPATNADTTNADTTNADTTNADTTNADEVAWDAASIPAHTVVIPLHPVTDALFSRYGNTGAVDVPLELTAVEASSSHLRVKVYLPYLQLSREDDMLRTEMLRVRVIYGMRK